MLELAQIMSFFHLSDPLMAARALLEQLQRQARVQYGFAAQEDDVVRFSEEDTLAYLASNPDYDDEERAAQSRIIASRQRLGSRLDVSGRDIGTQILAERIDNLKATLKKLPTPINIDNVCFGLIPGGGLDAFATKVPEVDAYAIVVPGGLFDLFNLLAKVVVLLQPIKEGGVYLPSASFEQLSLVSHPYIEFRARDLFRAFFVSGDPGAALPYQSAVPFQDRFVYLLIGAELFVLAHEVGHVVLGHFDAARSGLTSENEFAADAFAFNIVSRYFADFDKYHVARASLCEALVLGVTRMWEATIHYAIGTFEQVPQDFPELLYSTSGRRTLGSHPAVSERWCRFFNQLDSSAGDTPGWYMHVHNAVRLTTEQMAINLLAPLIERAGGIRGLSARVLPIGFAHLGNAVRTETPMTTIAGLLTSVEGAERRLGLYFFLEFMPYAGLALYAGLSNDDDVYRNLCSEALISIEPLYRDYFPRLNERFRETARDDQMIEYQRQITDYLMVKVVDEIGEQRLLKGPMWSEFFD